MTMKHIVLVHSIGLWLPITQSWLWRQLSLFESGKVSQYVVCDRVEHSEKYNMPGIMAFEQEKTVFKKYFSLIGFINKTNRSQYILHFLRKYKFTNNKKSMILHSHFGNRGYDNFIFAKKNGFKHVVSFYGFDASLLPKQNPLWLTRYHEMLAAVDVILCEGPHMRSQIISFNLDYAHKVKVLNIGVDLDLLPFHPRQWIPGQTLKVLMAGRFVEKKGFPYGIAALARLTSQIKIDLTIVGDSANDVHSQREKEKIIACLQEGKFNSVKMLGLVAYEHLLQEARQHHVFLAPSVLSDDGDSEGGCPVIITELVATGMPVISTTHGDIPYVLHQQVRLSEERDVDDLVRQFEDWLSHPDLWEQRTYHGRTHVESFFDVKKQSQKLLNIYSSLIIE